ncbi:MAG TPA: TetR/AcrR family transcriptional regulator [Kofleriaceae bacterium]
MHPPELDPRIKRTRAALREALATLLRDHAFEDITLNDLAEIAGLNRATIYKHYPDKFALLDAWIADDLRDRLFTAMTAGFEHDPSLGTGHAKFYAVVASTCHCFEWIATLGRPDDRLLRPIAEARIRSLLDQAIAFAIEQKVARVVAKFDAAPAMTSAVISASASCWAYRPAKSKETLSSHVNKTLEALASIVEPNPKLPPRLTRALVFT